MAEYQHIPQTRHVNASDFFHNLEKKVKAAAELEAEKMANSMVFVLRNRQRMKGGFGQSPKWNPSRFKYSVKRPPSKRSHLHWAVQKRPNGEFWITNDAQADNGYNYLKPVLSGTGWSKTVLAGNFRRLVHQGSLVFSDQLPEGINPWLDLKRNELENKIKQAIKNVRKK